MYNAKDRVMIFIDGSNLYHLLKSNFNRTNIDLEKFAHKLAGIYGKLIRVYYYNAVVSKKHEPERFYDQQTFYNSVEAIPYFEMRLGHLIYIGWPNSRPYEKGTDVMLATDMVAHAFRHNFDTAILVASDNDYVGALQVVKDVGKNIEVVLVGKDDNSSSMALRKSADDIIVADEDYLKDCWQESFDA